MSKQTFALFFGNRGFFPGESIASAINDIKKAVTDCRFNYICMDESKTCYGAIETMQEGKIYAEFLKKNEDKIDGIIVCLPNFGDENGVCVALKNARVPILIQAYPDTIGEMDFAHRRDAMCGKFAICNVLRQNNIKFTLTDKFVVNPLSEDFYNDLKRFAAICRVVKGMKSFNIGAMGARTTAFKTVRCDEIALAQNGINVETIDMSDIFSRMRRVTEEEIIRSTEKILNTAVFEGWPDDKLKKMAALHTVLEELMKDYDLQAIAMRCWSELQTEIGIAPCYSMGILGEMGINAACEVDITNSIMMRALSLASDGTSTLLDFNNNYSDCDDKAIMFHCGPLPISMMEGKGRIEEHLMFKKSYGAASGVGVNKGVIKSGNITFGSIKTENGKIHAFVTEGEFTQDPIESSFFGCGKVVKKENINNMSNYMAENGYKHHLAVTFGYCATAINEALGKYLGYTVDII